MNNETPLACDLSAINDDELQTHKANSESVFTSIQDVKKLSNGYAFRIPTETKLIERAGAFVARERKCCPFFNFSLEVPAEHGPVWLKITGDEQVRNFIKLNIVAQMESDKENCIKPENTTD